MKRLTFLMVSMIPFLVYSMENDPRQNNLLLLQSRQQVRQNNACEVADALKTFREARLSELPQKEFETFVTIVRASEISRSKKKETLARLEADPTWALLLLKRDLQKRDDRPPKRRRIN